MKVIYERGNLPGKTSREMLDFFQQKRDSEELKAYEIICDSKGIHIMPSEKLKEDHEFFIESSETGSIYILEMSETKRSSSFLFKKRNSISHKFVIDRLSPEYKIEDVSELDSYGSISLPDLLVDPLTNLNYSGNIKGKYTEHFIKNWGIEQGSKLETSLIIKGDSDSLFEEVRNFFNRGYRPTSIDRWEE